MGPKTLLSAWLFSLAALALPLPVPAAGVPLAHLPLVLAPWLALAWLPLGAPASRPEQRHARQQALHPLAAWALSLPVLVLAAGLDRAEGRSDAQLAILLSGGLLLLAAALGFGIRARASGALAAAQLAIVYGLPLCVLALGWGAGLERAPLWLERASRLSPLRWLWDEARSGAGSVFPWIPLGWAVAAAAAPELASKLREPRAAAIALACLCCPLSWSAAVPHPAQEPLKFASLQLTGPLEHVALDWGGTGRLALDCPLAVGETRNLRVPLPPGPAAQLLAPSVELDGDSAARGGRARLGPPERPPSSASPAPPLRVRPPVGPGRSRPALAAWALLVAGGIAGWAARRRPAPALVCALASILAVTLAAAPRAAPDRRLAVLELRGAARLGRLVEAGWQELALEARPGLAIVTRPESRALELSLSCGAPSQLRLHAQGACLYALSELAIGVAGSDARNNARNNVWGNLDEAWIRGPSGAWRPLGPWPQGRPRPAPGVARAAPGLPGWLASGLPQGVGVLLGRFAPGALASEPPAWAAAPPTACFLRLTHVDLR